VSEATKPIEVSSPELVLIWSAIRLLRDRTRDDVLAKECTELLTKLGAKP
jgi:hypothetical protein